MIRDHNPEWATLTEGALQPAFEHVVTRLLAVPIWSVSARRSTVSTPRTKWDHKPRPSKML